MTISPPSPAPYLHNLNGLPDDLLEQLDGRKSLSGFDDLRAQVHLRELTSEIRRRRVKYERQRGVTIAPERAYGVF